MAKRSTLGVGKYDFLKDNRNYVALVKQIDIVRNAITKQRYIDDETKITSLKEGLAKLILARDNYKSKFATEQYNELITTSTFVIEKLKE